MLTYYIILSILFVKFYNTPIKINDIKRKNVFSQYGII